MTISIESLTSFLAFWMIFSRIFPMIIQMPILGEESVPLVIKILSSFSLTLFLHPVVSSLVEKEIQIFSLEKSLGLLIFYTISGIFLGFVYKIIFFTISSAGKIVALGLGFNAGEIFDPSSGGQVSAIEKLLQVFLFLLVANSFLWPFTFRAIIESFSGITLSSLGDFTPEKMQWFLDFFKTLFWSSLALAFPILLANFFLNIAMGVVARVIPQVNVLMLGLIVNMIAGMSILVVILPQYLDISLEKITGHLEFWWLMAKK